VIPANGRPTDLPLEAGKLARSNLNVFFDPDFPRMSESIRDCMTMAEHYRYKAFAEMEVYDRMFDILKKATELKPPHSPHPTQFQPAPAGPLTNPGNT
jgi:hypothetical protein